MKEILFYPNKMKNLVIIFISILFSSLAISFLYKEILFSKNWFIALACLGFFGVLLLVLLYKTFINPIPYFKLNEIGLSANKCPFIEWNNVRNVQIKKKAWAAFLCIFPYNANKLVDKENLSAIKKLKLSIIKAIFGTVIVIRMDDLYISQKDVLDLINEFKKNWADKYLRN